MKQTLTSASFLRKCLEISPFVLLASLLQLPVYAAETSRVLWYRQPALQWTEALPIGNGRLGAMVFGGVGEERLSLNEDTLYAGEPGPSGVPEIHSHVDRVFQLIRAGKYAEADRTVCEHMLGRNHQTYTTMGNLRLRFDHGDVKCTDYRRELDIGRAIARVDYCIGDVTYQREMFASTANQVIVVRLTCNKPGHVSVTASLDTPHRFARLGPTGEAAVALSAKLPMHGCNRSIAQIRKLGDTHKYPRLFDAAGNLLVRADEADKLVYAATPDGPGMSFCAELRAVVEGGSATADENGLRIESADAVTFLLAADSSFAGFDRSPSRDGVDPSIACREDLARAAARSYGELRRRHVADYRALFDRVNIELGPATTGELPMDERIRRFTKTHDPALLALYFQYGRYLMIASSRPGTQPANLQGLWSDQVHAPWNGGYTTNINSQMNYWLAEPGNLAECHEPLIRLIEETAVNGRITAEKSYHARGWVCHHNVSIWRVTDPLDNQARFSFWPMAGGWLCRHLWEHFEFGSDVQYLRDKAYPLMKEAAEFYLDWLQEDGHGRLVTPVATSPENRFTTPDGETASVSMASTMDMAIISDLFGNTLAAARVLDVDHEFQAELAGKRARLYPYQVGRWGQLQEWYRDWDDPKDGHRHLSHLYGACPGQHISPDAKPELARAVATTLKVRGTGDVGFNRAWSVNLWARLGDAERAYERLAAMLADGVSPNLFTQCYAGRPLPFDVDPNLGGPAGMVEMLLQSRLLWEDGRQVAELRLLPALPAAWPAGCVRGLRARGGFEVDICWSGGRMTRATIRSKSGNPCRMHTADECSVSNNGNLVCSVRSGEARAFSTNRGEVYEIRRIFP